MADRRTHQLIPDTADARLRPPSQQIWNVPLWAVAVDGTEHEGGDMHATGALNPLLALTIGLYGPPLEENGATRLGGNWVTYGIHQHTEPGVQGGAGKGGGSPGVTTTALALAYAWQGRALLAECDAQGGDVLRGFLAGSMDEHECGLLALALAVAHHRADPQHFPIGLRYERPPAQGPGGGSSISGWIPRPTPGSSLRSSRSCRRQTASCPAATISSGRPDPCHTRHHPAVPAPGSRRSASIPPCSIPSPLDGRSGEHPLAAERAQRGNDLGWCGEHHRGSEHTR
jgi:hypothetical protein